MTKLPCLSIDPLILSWIYCFLTDRSQYTIIEDHPSVATNVISGVPQGFVLGPHLFLIFNNDLPAQISSTIRLFADDCVLYRRISTTNNQALLQDDLTLIQNWCSTWLMQLNVSKCKFMHVTRKKHLLLFPYMINNFMLAQVESYRYLGLEITDNLSWSKDITSLSASIFRSLGFVRRSLTFASPTVRQMGYKTFICTKLEDASPLWNPHQEYLIQELEAIQNRAARFITPKYDFRLIVISIKTSIGVTPLASRRKIQVSAFFISYTITFLNYERA